MLLSVYSIQLNPALTFGEPGNSRRWILSKIITERLMVLNLNGKKEDPKSS